MTETSRLPGLHRMSVAERRAAVAAAAGLPADAFAPLDPPPALASLMDHLSENNLGALSIPVGVATNLVVDGAPVLVPMATEEASVVAAVCNGARRMSGDGVRTSADAPEMIAQVQILDVPDPEAARLRVLEAEGEIRALCDACDPGLIAAGGGARAVEARAFPAMLIVHLVVDVRDAMGANAVNTMAEAVAPRLASLAGGRAGLRILSNLADRRRVRARAVWPADAIGGPEARDGVLAAAAFAEADPYRAATHNKGIMNGISAVALATGNDTRALEAGAHAFAARAGRYGPLTRWAADGNGDLTGVIELPMAVGVVGGATRAHPAAQTALKIMGVTGADRLGRVMAAVGLVQNLSAMLALATVGIQRGHMALHARNVAVTAGAEGAEVDAVAGRLVAEGAVRADRAAEVLAELRG